MSKSKTTSGLESVTLVYGLKLTSSHRISSDKKLKFLNNKLDVQDHIDPVTGDAIRSFIVYILERQAPKTIIYRTPKTWFQHFKRDMLPAWMLKISPVREHVETVKISDIYPFPNKTFSEDIGEPIRYATHSFQD